MSNVGIVHCERYELYPVLSAIRKIAENTNFPEVKDKCVLVKPNILSDVKSEAGITTNPIVVEAVIMLLKERGAKRILVGDSPGLQSPTFQGKLCGINDVCKRTNSEWVNFASSSRTHILDKRTKVIMTSVLDEIDLSISVAKFKTHQLMYMTGCAKNMFGLLPGLNKSPCHLKAPTREAFAKLLCKIYKESKCEYGFLDGIVGMEGPGPANGTLRYVGYLLGGKDPFAVDKAEATIMGYKAEDMPLLTAGKAEGLTDLNVTYPLLDANKLIIKDYRRITVEKKTKLFSALILPYFTRSSDKKRARERKAPIFNDDKCVHCKRCIEICPAKALVMKEGKVVIDTSKCIRCYCCHEMCPADAITI